MKIGVGVVTFNNSQEDLRKFARAFSIAAREVTPAVSLFFVDNGNPSHLSDLFQKSPDGNLEVQALPSQGNVGYTRAINRLMKAAFDENKLDGFITANPDGAFHHAAYLNFIKRHTEFPQAVLEARQFPEEHSKVYDPVKLDTSWCSGCCIFIPRKIYEKVGPFDENFFMYMEDVDFSWRVRSQGFQIKLCPDVLYCHFVFGRPINETAIKQQYVSGRYLAWKWGHRRFFRWAQKTLLRKKGFTQQSLPALTEKKPHFSRRERMVTYFKRAFFFSETRW